MVGREGKLINQNDGEDRKVRYYTVVTVLNPVILNKNTYFFHVCLGGDMNHIHLTKEPSGCLPALDLPKSNMCA